MPQQVEAYAKNNHPGFQVYFLWNGSKRRFIPDFLIGLKNGATLEFGDQERGFQQNRTKRAALDAWVRPVNARGGFGKWCWDVAFEPANIYDILQKHAMTPERNPQEAGSSIQ